MDIEAKRLHNSIQEREWIVLKKKYQIMLAHKENEALNLYENKENSNQTSTKRPGKNSLGKRSKLTVQHPNLRKRNYEEITPNYFGGKIF